jgi:hypothetical protein
MGWLEFSWIGCAAIRVRNGKSAEAVGYAKTPPRTTLGQLQ